MENTIPIESEGDEEKELNELNQEDSDEDEEEVLKSGIRTLKKDPNSAEKRRVVIVINLHSINYEFREEFYDFL